MPQGSLVAGAFAERHYADAYAVDLPDGATRDADELTRLIATSSPWWVESLMWLRDRLVSVVGLRTSERDPTAGQEGRFKAGDKAGMFEVFARSGDEVLLGGDDRHLDFRASVLVRRGQRRDSVVFSTVVHYNNWQGRAYFVVVRPFHGIIVRSVLRAVAKDLRVNAKAG